MDPLATVTDLGNWLAEDLTDSDRAPAVLDHASSLVRIAAGVTWLDPATVPDGIAQITVRVAARFWGNPSGLKSATTGPFSGTFGDMELTAGERAEIAQIINPGSRRGIGTISTTRGPLETELIFVEVTNSAKPIEVSREPW